jgi:hypothetical protein
MTTQSSTPVFEADDPICDALFATAKAERNRYKEYREGPIEIDYGILSNDPRILQFKDDFSRDWLKRIEPDVDGQGRVFGNGLRSDFNGMRHVNGFPMYNATYPLADNRKLRAKEGLANEFVEPWHKSVFEALVELFFEDLEPVKMNIRKGSSSCMPYFETGMAKKIEYAKYAHENSLKAGELMLKGDFSTSWDNYGIGGAAFCVYRRQSTDVIYYDSKTNTWSFKERPVADRDFAVSGGDKGTFLPSNKKLDNVDFNVPDGFARERNRTAMGAPWGLNASLAPIAQSVRHRIYDVFSYSTHHTTRESIQNDLRAWKFTIAADVSNHDWFWPTFVIDTITDKLLAMGFDERWVVQMKVCNLLPRYVTDVGPGMANILIGDPRNPNVHGGLTSGNSFTDIFGTINMIWIYFLIQVEHTYTQIIPALKERRRCKELVKQYLQGNLPIVIKDKSDDALLGWTDTVLVGKAQKLMDKMQKDEQVSPYMKVSYEHGGAFLGSILLYPRDKDPSKLVLIGNIQSLVTNLFSPEYGVQSQVKDRSKVKRPFPGLSWETIPQVYGSCPLYGEVMESIEKHWYNNFSESFFARKQKQLESDKAKLARYIAKFQQVGSIDFSPIDLEVLNDPTKLEYKFDKEDVSPEVLDFLYQGLTLEEVEPFFNSIIGAN